MPDWMLDGTMAARQRNGMKLFFRALVLSSFVAGCAAEPAPAPAATSTSAAEIAAAPFTWPVPAGWRSETIPFPLAFAPSLPHRGTEELRFGPRFFDPKSPTYFTYSFAFVTKDEATITADALASELATYFHGLASAATGSPSDPSLHGATITPAKDGLLRGTVHTIDAFGDKRPLTLAIAAKTLSCGERQIVVSALSPSHDPAIVREVEAVRDAFACAR